MYKWMWHLWSSDLFTLSVNGVFCLDGGKDLMFLKIYQKGTCKYQGEAEGKCRKQPSGAGCAVGRFSAGRPANPKASLIQSCSRFTTSCFAQITIQVLWINRRFKRTKSSCKLELILDKKGVTSCMSLPSCMILMTSQCGAVNVGGGWGGGSGSQTEGGGRR